MYRERIASTPTKSEESARLKRLMLTFHDYQNQAGCSDRLSHKNKVCDWQTNRLKTTHQDLYNNLNFKGGIDFLLSELYSSQNFQDRDRDLERIFPKLIKLLPESLISTVANLVELNLLTQRLDDAVSIEMLEQNISVSSTLDISASEYAEAYRRAMSRADRERQLVLVAQAGDLLDRHARNPVLRFSLSVTKNAANRAGLSALHNFLLRGLDAFSEMRDVDLLMQTLIDRESKILDQLYSGHHNPFEL